MAARHHKQGTLFIVFSRVLHALLIVSLALPGGLPIAARAEADSVSQPTAVATTIPPTEAPTPTITDATPAAAEEPGPTPTPTPTLTPTPEPSPTPTTVVSETLPAANPPAPTATPNPAAGETLALRLEARLSALVPGDPLAITWEISPALRLAGAELAVTSPTGFTPAAGSPGSFDPTTGELHLALSATNGRLAWESLPEARGPFTFTARLLASGFEQARASLALAEEGLSQVDGLAGGVVEGLGGQARVRIPPASAAGELEVRISRWGQANQPAQLLSGLPVEIVARQAGGAELHHFDPPLEISLQYDPEKYQGQEGSLSLYWYDPANGAWLPLRTHIDVRNHTLTALTGHLSQFSYDAAGWQATRLPDLAGFQVSGFGGAATYSYPLWTPPGPGGLQPQLGLSYSSATADGANGQTQASWVGLGWSLEPGAIERNMNGTDGYHEDDTYSITAGGVSGMLLRDQSHDPAGGGVHAYQTSEQSFWRIWAHVDGYGHPIWWEAWDGQGTHYVFGEDEADRARYPAFSFDDGDCTAGYQQWKWGLSRVIDRFDQALEYSYSHETHVVWDKCDDEGVDTFTLDTALYPQDILYPHGRYQVYFVTGSRADYDNGWTGRESYKFFMRSRLEKVQIRHGVDENSDGKLDELVKEYRLGYASSSGYLLPGIQWPGGGRTLTLLSVQEYGRDGSSSLPANSFTYNALHLVEGDNGYGGRVEFDYEQWYDSAAAESSQTKQDFGIAPEACSWLFPQDTFWNEVGNSTVECSNGRMHVAGEAYKLLALPQLAPGSTYQVSAVITGTNLQLGLSDGVTSWYSPVASSGPITATFPLPDNAAQARALVKCTDCVLDYHILGVLPNRYRVTEKRLYDGLDANPQTFSYRYDGPASNDTVHSAAASLANPYTPPYSEGRGHALVEESGPGGRVSLTWYGQDDERKGRSLASLAGGQEYGEMFEATSTSSYSPTWELPYAGSGTSIERVDGDNALRTSNSDAVNWKYLNRWNETLQDGEAIWLHFKASGAGVDNMLAAVHSSYGNAAYKRWGIKAVAGQALLVEYANGYSTSQYSSGLTFAADTWYVLLLVLDNDHLLARVWERDHPEQMGEVQLADPSGMQPGYAWRFRQWVRSGDAWLDAYGEGRVLSWSASLYGSLGFAEGPLPEKDEQTVYSGLGITWTMALSETQHTFEGDGAWVGVRKGRYYDESQSEHYGNLTRTVEQFWNGSGWVNYRASRTRYYPNDSDTRYLVGLPASQESYACPGGSCDLGVEDLLRGSWSLYDTAVISATQPVTGVLSASRTLACFANDSNECLPEGYDPAYTRLLTSDEKYSYDAYGNLTLAQRYSGYGYVTRSGGTSVLASAGEQRTSSVYDSLYHTYVLTSTNALTQSVGLQYDYALGAVLTETVGGVSTWGVYDVFGRLVKVIRPGDSSGSPTLAFGYADTGTPFSTQATQKIDGATSFTIKKYYDGLGRLVQTRQVGAVVGGQSRDIRTDTYYDAYGQVVQQSMPYDVDGQTGFSRTGSYLTTTAYDVLGRTVAITHTDETTQTFAYSATLLSGIPYLESTAVDAKGNTTLSRGDVWGRAARVIPATGPGVDYGYDAAGRLITATYGAAESRLWYDLAGRKLKMDDPDMGVWAYEYNSVGSLVAQEDARGCTTSLGYDPLNRLTSKSYSGCPSTVAATQPVSYTYDDDVYAEPFSGASLPAGWTMTGTVTLGSGVVTLVGDGTWNNYLIRNNNQALMDGQVVEFSFMVSNNAVARDLRERRGHGDGRLPALGAAGAEQHHLPRRVRGYQQLHV